MAQPNIACSLNSKQCSYPVYEKRNITSEIDTLVMMKPNYPASIRQCNFTTEMMQVITEYRRRGNMTLVHLSDIHLDLKYIEGSNSQCNLPMCCREDSGT